MFNSKAKEAEQLTRDNAQAEFEDQLLARLQELEERVEQMAQTLRTGSLQVR